jgi:hypothetical protein
MNRFQAATHTTTENKKKIPVSLLPFAMPSSHFPGI